MSAQLKEHVIAEQGQWHGESNQHGDEAAIFMLSEDGMILDANKDAVRLLGHSTTQSNGQHISRIIPQLANVDLLEDGERVNSYLRYLSRIGHYFKVIGMNGMHFSGESYFNDIKVFNQHQIIVMIYPAH